MIALRSNSRSVIAVTRQRRCAFTLIELLIVISILAIIAGMVIPAANPSLHDQLDGTADVVVTDIVLARSLAVSNDSTYRVTFDLANNRYTLTHTGTNSALDTLPKSPFRDPSDPDNQHIVRLADLPNLGQGVRLHAVRAMSTSPQNVTHIEFGPLGETTRAEDTQIWLAAGAGTATRYLSIQVNAVTGICKIDGFSAKDPLVSGS